MRVQNKGLQQNEARRGHVDESKRRDLKRLAAIACAVALGSAFVSAGCQATKGGGSETVGDYLSEKKPSW